MFLRFRPVRLSDLEECSHCIQDGFLYDDEMRRHLLAFWQYLLQRGAMTAAVIEDIAAPVGQRIVWFCAKVFPTAEYAAYLQSGDAPPFYSHQFLLAWMKGARPPLLELAEIQRINGACGDTAGMTLLVLHHGSPQEILHGEKWPIVADKLIAFTEYFSSGYRAGALIEEFYGDFTFGFAQNAGFRLCTDYAAYFAAAPAQRSLPPAERRPRLLHTTVEQARKMPGTLASAIFRYEPPRFFFRPAEQELLLHALVGETDKEAAALLNVAKVTVTKRWQSIYDRATQTAPALFPETLPQGTPKKNGRGRGAEKKRRLLTYLRHHPEELRPLPHENQSDSPQWRDNSSARILGAIQALLRFRLARSTDFQRAAGGSSNIRARA